MGKRTQRPEIELGRFACPSSRQIMSDSQICVQPAGAPARRLDLLVLRP